MTTGEKRNYFIILLIAVIVSGVVGGLAGFTAADSVARSQPFLEQLQKVVTGNAADPRVYLPSSQISIVGVVDQASPAVVSIIVTKDLPRFQRSDSDLFRRFFGEEFPVQPDQDNPLEKQQIGGGSGFFVSADGLIVTNKHVVADEAAEYTVVTTKGDRYTAKVLARDPANDLAVLKVEGKDFPVLELGNSDELKIGQSVIAIGNALGEFSNTVSTGVVSGLSRSITAAGQGGRDSEQLLGLIQTDASINPGNSGGPLLNTAGKVIGINVAVAQGAQNIGFAIPINQVTTAIQSVREHGRLIRAWLGVRYQLINDDIAKEQKLPKDYGALLVKGDNDSEAAIIKDSPAAKAGLQEGDIILSANGKDITEENPLSLTISRAKPGDKLELVIWRDGKERTLIVTLEEMK